MAFRFGNQIVTEGLVLYLDAANPSSYPGSGTVWNDLTANRNNGTLTNGPTFNSANGGSIVFDGANDTVEVGKPSSLYIADSLTLMSWIYVTNTANFGTIIGKWSSSGVGAKMYKSSVFQTTNQFYIDVSSNGTNDTYRLSEPLLTNTWYHTTGVYTSGASPSLDVYINGQLSNGTLVGTVPATLPATNIANITLGNDNSGSTNFFNGRIAIACIYNRALSPAEVLQNYNALKSRFGL